MRAMLEREANGLEVSVSWDELTESVVLVCARDDEVAVTEIPPDKCFDAFDHPATYLPPEQLPLLG